MTPEEFAIANTALIELRTAERKLDHVLAAKQGHAARITLYIDGQCVCDLLPLDLLDLVGRLGEDCEVKRRKFEAL